MHAIDRRSFLATTSAAALAAATGRASETPTVPLGKAEHCIFMWLGGGAAQMDTWDQKRKGDAKAKKPGSYYDGIDTAIPGVQVCEHLGRCAPIMDRFNPIRTVHHSVIDEHALATNMMHTGRPITETVIYPSIGSIVAHERGAAGQGVPAYVLIGYPNVTRGPGFLGAKANYVYLTDTQSGPAGLSRPADITTTRQQRRERLLGALRADYRGRESDDARVTAYDETI